MTHFSSNLTVYIHDAVDQVDKYVMHLNMSEIKLFWRLSITVLWAGNKSSPSVLM